MAEASAASPLPCAPTLMLEPISCPRSGRLPVAGGETDDEPSDTALSEGARELEAGIADGGVGGARPLPLPRMRPPPSLRPDIGGEGEAKLAITEALRRAVAGSWAATRTDETTAAWSSYAPSCVARSVLEEVDLLLWSRWADEEQQQG